MTQIAKEYASALFSLSKEADNTNEIFESVRLIKKVLEENQEYTRLLSSPDIQKDERINLVNTAFGDSLPALTNSFVAVLINNGHIGEFIEIAEEFFKLYEADINTATAYVKSAVSLSEDELVRLKEKLQQVSCKQVRFELVVDPSILGGIIVELDGKVYDGSIKHKLKTAKDVMGK